MRKCILVTVAALAAFGYVGAGVAAAYSSSADDFYVFSSTRGSCNVQLDANGSLYNPAGAGGIPASDLTADTVVWCNHGLSQMWLDEPTADHTGLGWWGGSPSNCWSGSCPGGSATAEWTLITGNVAVEHRFELDEPNGTTWTSYPSFCSADPYGTLQCDTTQYVTVTTSL
jgi:hypothetical protein